MAMNKLSNTSFIEFYKSKLYTLNYIFYNY